ncbi:helix-turn-helix domain-containing protein [Puia sp. P3]|uniref:helix-turn-helix domain-containing protein n=1 Tax=Puia sp. P3 TaxID=3423952 RepID=UPI003D676935
MNRRADMDFEYTEIPPTGLLKKYIKHFYIFNSRDTSPERILPLGNVEITVSVGDGGNNVLITNMGTQSYFVVPSALKRMVGISLQPWGLYGLLRISPAEIANSKIPLEDVLPPHFRELVHRVQDNDDPGRIIATLQHYLLRHGEDRGHEMIGDAVSIIDKYRGQLQLSDLFKRYYLSPRRLEQLFDRSVGMSVKKYSRLKRFHFAVTQLKKDTHLTALALNAGYYDQSHFIHEFGEFAGVSPRVFLKESNTLNLINARSWFGK